MRDYKNQSPIFKDTIKVYEPSDPVDAETVSNVPLKQLADNDNVLKEAIDGMALAAEQEVKDMADELMDGAAPGPEPPEEIATDEEVEEAIENLDDL